MARRTQPQGDEWEGNLGARGQSASGLELWTGLRDNGRLGLGRACWATPAPLTDHTHRCQVGRSCDLVPRLWQPAFFWHYFFFWTHIAVFYQKEIFSKSIFCSAGLDAASSRGSLQRLVYSLKSGIRAQSRQDPIESAFRKRPGALWLGWPGPPFLGFSRVLQSMHKRPLHFLESELDGSLFSVNSVYKALTRMDSGQAYLEREDPCQY